MTAEKIPTQAAVQISRVMRLPGLVALGASVSAGLGVYTLLGQYMQLSPSQAAGAYLLLVIVGLPIVLTYAERAAVIPGGGGAYNLAQAGELGWLAYISGWLLLGGFVSLIALLGWGGGLHLNLILKSLFEQTADLPTLAVAIIGLMALNNLLGTSRTRQTRAVIITTGILLLLYIVLRNLFVPLPVAQTTRLFFGPPRRIIGITTLMASGLWGFNYILNVRDETVWPARTILPALLLTTVLGAGLGTLAALGAERYPAVIQLTLTPLVQIITDYSSLAPELVSILYALFGLLIALIALNQGIVSSLRLLGAMTQDGFFPKKVQKVQTISGEYRTLVGPTILLALVSIVLVIYLPTLILVGLAAMTFLWSSALVHLPDLFRKKPNLPEDRRLKLPFHPLLPGLTVAIGLLLPLTLRFEVWRFGAAWLLLGGLYYALYARRGGMIVRRRAAIVGEMTSSRAVDESQYRVMVGIANLKTATNLVRAGAKLAQAKKGNLLILHVLVMAEQIPTYLGRQAAQAEWESLKEVVQQIGITEVGVNPLVRLAPSPASGILETVREEGVDLLLLGWRGDSPADDLDLDPILDPIISTAPCDVAILRGRVPETIKRIVVPTAGGPHAPVALLLGHDLAVPNDGQIAVVNFVSEYLSPELTAEAKAHLEATLILVNNNSTIERRVAEIDNTVKEGILAEAETCDLLIMGVSKEGFMEKSTLNGLPTEVASASPKPVLLVKHYEGARYFWIQRLWEILTGPLPALTSTRRDEVLLQMRQAAQPTVDFFVLIILSAAIATVGLLQSSGAVIIGAMLVAPLMSPILAMGISIVHGNLSLLRVAAEATMKGIFLAIFVGVVVTLISPIIEPTVEITNRISPNILDLMIAIASGAAAAYAVSRKEVAAALPGVAIAVSLVPPLGVVGYGLGTSQLNIAAGALVLFLTNLTAIIFASVLTFLALGFYPKLVQQEQKTIRSRGFQITLASLIVISIILGLVTATTVRQFNRERRVESIFRELVADQAEVVELRVESSPNGFKISPTLIVFELSDLPPEELENLERQLIEATGAPVTIDATILQGNRVRLYE